MVHYGVAMATRREALRQRRRQLGFTQEVLAYSIGVAPTTYRDWELGVTTPRVGFRRPLARRLDVSLVEVDRMLDGDRRDAVPDGLSVPSWLGHFAALEQGASRIWTYEPLVVPGLLQTPCLCHGGPSHRSRTGARTTRSPSSVQRSYRPPARAQP